MSIRIFLGISIVFLFISCDREVLNGDQVPYSLKPVDTIRFEVPNYMSKYWNNIKYIDSDSGDYLYTTDYLNPNNIYIYSFNSDSTRFEVSRFIKTDRVGPNGVGRISGIYIQHRDSIFIVDNAKYKMSIINNTGKVIRSYNLLQNKSEGIITAQPDVGTNSEIQRSGDFVYLPSIPDVRSSNLGYRVNSLITKLNIRTGKSEYTSTFPDYYKDEGLGQQAFLIEHSRFRICLNKAKNKLIYSFAADNEIQVNSLNSLEKFEKSYTASSKNLDQFIKPLPYWPNEVSERTFFQLTTDKYLDIRSDDGRELYYRFYVPKHEEEVAKKIIARQGVDKKAFKPKGVVILDKDFNKIADIQIPKGISVETKFITKDHFYLQNYYDEAEDYIEFVKFRINSPIN